jgi:hypothetical protein
MKRFSNSVKNAGSQNPSRRGAPADYQILPEKRVVIVKFGKRVTEKEIAMYALSLRVDPVFDPAFSEIVDLREVEELDLHGNEMVELADKIDPFSLDAKRAFVVRDSTQAHAARMHQILRLSKDNISVFHSVEEAENWLGLKDSKSLISAKPSAAAAKISAERLA